MDVNFVYIYLFFAKSYIALFHRFLNSLRYFLNNFVDTQNFIHTNQLAHPEP